MRVAYYAPLKPPDHPVPSGDRRMARAFADLLEELGHSVELASRLRSFDRAGDHRRQARLAALGARLARRLVRRWRDRPPGERPDLWFTYHLHHKAPDWLGPPVARAVRIPYVVAEASIAAPQSSGPWATGFVASRDAIARADLVLAMTRKDRTGLAGTVAPDRLVLMPPFLDARPFAAAAARRARARAATAARLGLDAGAPWLVVVAMMRADAKLRSFTELAAALGLIADHRWQLLVAGDGPARGEVERLLAPLGEARVRLLGEVPPSALTEILAGCDLLIWPAVAEAYGMALLEAQAAGVPVVAGAVGGVPDIVADGVSGLLVIPGRPDLLAAAARSLLENPALRRRLGRQAAARVVAEHDTAVARGRLAAALARFTPPMERATCASA